MTDVYLTHIPINFVFMQTVVYALVIDLQKVLHRSAFIIMLLGNMRKYGLNAKVLHFNIQLQC